MINKFILLGVAFISVFSSVPSFASAPFAKAQAPGFYRMTLGDFEITVLFDGFYPMKPMEILSVKPKEKVDDLVPTSVNAFLINTGSKLILIDAGCGALFGPSFGQIMGNLKASGYSPDQVDEIEITHMHGDHLGGVVTAGGKAAFPHAILRVNKKDSDYWLNQDNAKTAEDPSKANFAYAAKAVAPYQEAGRFKPFQGETEITAGIRAIPAYGHTPGHTIYSIESKGQKLLLVGDLFHIEAIQFPEPTTTLLLFDFNPKDATAQRKKIFADAAKHGYLLGAAHLPFPGIGHVLAAKPGYRYLPIQYAPVP